MARKPEKIQPEESPTASDFFDRLKLDFNTIKIIILSAAAVLVIISIPLFFILRKFVTFDALDSYFSVSKNMTPKILRDISEEIDAGYSKNFVWNTLHPSDLTMLFYAADGQRVQLTVKEEPPLSVNPNVLGQLPPIKLYLNRCLVADSDGSEPLIDLNRRLYELDDSRCKSDQTNINLLKFILPKGIPNGLTVQVKCLVIVYERVRPHLGESRKQ